MSNQTKKTQPLKDRAWIITLTALFGISAVLLFYIIIRIWPSGYVSSKDPVRLFGVIYHITAEHRFLLLMILGGALGANVHLMISFTAFVGNRMFVTTWIPWYLLRPVIGAGMAMFFYMLLRGGILTYSPPVSPELPERPQVTQNTPAPAETASNVNEGSAKPDSSEAPAAAPDTVKPDCPPAATDSSEAIPASSPDEANEQRDSVPLNPYGMMAIACLVGLFSKEASEKLEEVFKTLFNVKEKAKYKDPLPENTTPTIAENTNGSSEGDTHESSQKVDSPE